MHVGCLPLMNFGIDFFFRFLVSRLHSVSLSFSRLEVLVGDIGFSMVNRAWEVSSYLLKVKRWERAGCCATNVSFIWLWIFSRFYTHIHRRVCACVRAIEVKHLSLHLFFLLLFFLSARPLQILAYWIAHLCYWFFGGNTLYVVSIKPPPVLCCRLPPHLPTAAMSFQYVYGVLYPIELWPCFSITNLETIFIFFVASELRVGPY